jgi:predicted RNA-binding protein with PUA-like domain
MEATMKYWLIKSEPNTYSWDDFVKLGKDHWDGVRNYQARNNMKEMKVGDQAFFYHSVNEKSIVGLVECVREYYPDPTIDDERWVVVDFKPIKKFEKSVTLNQIKSNNELSEMVLVKNSRLSVQPVRSHEFEIIIDMGMN